MVPGIRERPVWNLVMVFFCGSLCVCLIARIGGCVFFWLRGVKMHTLGGFDGQDLHGTKW